MPARAHTLKHTHMLHVLTHQLTECQLLLGHPMGAAPFIGMETEAQRGRGLPKMDQLDGGQWGLMPSVPISCMLRFPLGMVSPLSLGKVK